MGDLPGLGAGWLGGLGLGEMATVGAFLAALAGIGLTLMELRLFRRQLQLEALIQIMDANREIVSLGFTHPGLWRMLAGEEGVVLEEEALARRRYLQLWTNHMQVIWGAWRLGLVSGDEWQAYRLDLAESLNTPALREHWQRVARHYPRDFQRLVGRLSGEGEKE